VVAVKSLEINDKNARRLDNIGSYPELETLHIRCLEDLRALPESIGQLSKLKELDINNGNGCSMNPVLPESIGNLTSLEKLVLFGAQDPRAVDESDPVPRERHKFPAGMSRLKNLVYLDLGRNGLDEIPVFVKDLPRLQHLGFAWNGAKKLPPFLAGLHELTTIQLDSDDLSDLPGFLNTLPRLSYISLGGNCAITQKPTKMRDLKKRFPRISFDFENEYDCP